MNLKRQRADRSAAKWGKRMDLAYWGLRTQPFRTSVLPQAAYPLVSQVAAKQQILSAFHAGERVAVLCGPHGIGKSLVTQQIVTSCEEQGIASAWAACVPHVGSQALLQMLLADLGQPFVLRSPIELRLQLLEYLLPHAHEGKSFVLINDEAQHLAGETLEHLRPLVEFVSPRGTPVVHLLLVGTEALLQQLEQPSAAGLHAWVGSTSLLTPLDGQTALELLHGQWKQAGGQSDLQATEEAWGMLAELGRGIPLLLQRLSRASFEMARRQGQKVLDAEAVWEAAHELQLHLAQDVEGEDDIAAALPLRGDLKESA